MWWHSVECVREWSEEHDNVVGLMTTLMGDVNCMKTGSDHVRIPDSFLTTVFEC